MAGWREQPIGPAPKLVLCPTCADYWVTKGARCDRCARQMEQDRLERGVRSMKGITVDHPDYDAIRARAFEYLIGKGRLTNRDIDDAMDAGLSQLRYERLRAEIDAREAKAA